MYAITALNTVSLHDKCVCGAPPHTTALWRTDQGEKPHEGTVTVCKECKDKSLGDIIELTRANPKPSMMLSIEFNPANVIAINNNQILLRVPHYLEYGNGCRLLTVRGGTQNDYQANPAKSTRSIFVGPRGGIHME